MKANKERTKRMTNMLNQLSKLSRLTKTKYLSILTISALMLVALFSRADDRNQAQNDDLPGTWLSSAEPGVPPSLFSFMSDGREPS